MNIIKLPTHEIQENLMSLKLIPFLKTTRLEFATMSKTVECRPAAIHEKKNIGKRNMEICRIYGNNPALAAQPFEIESIE